jgi:hypothetical protein
LELADLASALQSTSAVPPAVAAAQSPDPGDLTRADAVIESLDDLTEAVVDPALR